MTCALDLVLVHRVAKWWCRACQSDTPVGDQALNLSDVGEAVKAIFVDGSIVDSLSGDDNQGPDTVAVVSSLHPEYFHAPEAGG